MMRDADKGRMRVPREKGKRGEWPDKDVREGSFADGRMENGTCRGVWEYGSGKTCGNHSADRRNRRNHSRVGLPPAWVMWKWCGGAERPLEIIPQSDKGRFRRFDRGNIIKALLEPKEKGDTGARGQRTHHCRRCGEESAWKEFSLHILQSSQCVAQARGCFFVP